MSIFTIEEDRIDQMEREIPSGIYLYVDCEQTSVEEVAGICPDKDDPNMRCLTIRSLIIGLIFVLSMSFYHMWYYVNTLYAVIPPVIVVLLGHLIGKVYSKIVGNTWTIKEDSIILIMSNMVWRFIVVYDFSGLSFVQFVEKNSSYHFVYIFFFTISIQYLGFGLAGILRRFLVWPSSEVWPSNFPSIALLRILHQKKENTNVTLYGFYQKLNMWQKLISNQRLFYLVIAICQFIFYWFPGYIMPVLSGFSWICMIKPDNYVLAQLTDYRGLSLGSFSLNWYSVTFFLNSPLVAPRWALITIGIGFVLIAWILTPIVYFCNVWYTHRNAIASGTQSTEIWSAMGLVTTFTTFASISSVFVHMFLYHSKSLLKQLRTRSLHEKGNDVHCRLISYYSDVPDWWFGLVSVVAIIILIIVGELSKMLSWYNVLFAVSIPILFVLPFGKVASITGQLIQNQGVYYVMVLIVGALWSYDKRQMMSFVGIGYTTYSQTLYLVSSMKLGHYMKIPPRTLFFVQSLTCLVCTAFGSFIHYYFFGIKRYYEQEGAFYYQSEFDLTNIGSVLVNNTNFFDSSTSRNFTFLWGLLVGALLPIPFWLASQRYKWCRFIHIPLVLSTVSWMPLVDAGTLLTWLLIGITILTIFRKECWKRHIYLASSALDTGMYLCIAIIGGPLIYYNIKFPVWWGTGGPTGTGCPFSKPNAALQQSFDPQTYAP